MYTLYRRNQLGVAWYTERLRRLGFSRNSKRARIFKAIPTYTRVYWVLANEGTRKPLNLVIEIVVDSRRTYTKSADIYNFIAPFVTTLQPSSLFPFHSLFEYGICIIAVAIDNTNFGARARTHTHTHTHARIDNSINGCNAIFPFATRPDAV